MLHLFFMSVQNVDKKNKKALKKTSYGNKGGFEINIDLAGFLVGAGAGANVGYRGGEIKLGLKISTGVGGGVEIGIRKK